MCLCFRFCLKSMSISVYFKDSLDTDIHKSCMPVCKLSMRISLYIHMICISMSIYIYTYLSYISMDALSICLPRPIPNTYVCTYICICMYM